MNPTPLHPNLNLNPVEEKPTSANLSNRRLAPRGPEVTEAMAATLSRPVASFPGILPPYPDSVPSISPRLQPPSSSGPSMNQPVSPTSSYSSSTSFSRNTAFYKRNELPPPRPSKIDSNRVPRGHRDVVEDHLSDSSVRSHGIKRSYDMYAAIRYSLIPAPSHDELTI